MAGSRRAVPVAAAAAGALLALVGPSSSAGSGWVPLPYTVVPAGYQESPEFVVTYVGVGKVHTVFHATPPNPGGAPDTNDADDSSTQAWSLRFRQALVIPACGEPADPDPCSGVQGLNGARGATKVAARIHHTHVDGLFKQLDSTDNCRLRSSTPASAAVIASIGLRYDAATRTIKVTAHNPLTTALTLLRGYCPQRPDGIDRIRSNYASPGFSFDTAYDADRWFTSRTIAIPADELHRAAVVQIPVADTPSGRPPRNCAVKQPAIERCTTVGSWRGVLTFTRTG